MAIQSNTAISKADITGAIEVKAREVNSRPAYFSDTKICIRLLPLSAINTFPSLLMHIWDG